MNDPIFDERLANHERTLLRAVRVQFFSGNPVKISIRMEGYGISKTGDYVLGCRAGPGIHLSNLFHEMGHLAERETPKLLLRDPIGWGYYYGKEYNIPGYSQFWEPENSKSVHREKRIAAYQLSLCRHFGLGDGVEFAVETVRSFVYLPAWVFYKVEVGANSDSLAVQVLAEEADKLSRTEFNYDRFVAAWQERMLALAEPYIAESDAT